MKLSKKQRGEVFAMLGGRCAYCGHELGEKWHADHVEPVVRKLEFVRAAGKPTTMRTTGEAWYPERDHIGNLMPACVPCNIRKGGESLDSFRTGMERAIEVMRNNHSTYRHALRFGLIEEKPAKVVFYFEKLACPATPSQFLRIAGAAGPLGDEVECPECKGSGLLDTSGFGDLDACDECHGKGTVGPLGDEGVIGDGVKGLGDADHE